MYRFDAATWKSNNIFSYADAYPESLSQNLSRMSFKTVADVHHLRKAFRKALRKGFAKGFAIEIPNTHRPYK